MNNRTKLIVLLLSVPLVYVFVKLVFYSSEAREAYSIISAWWFSLFLFSFLRFKSSDWKGVAMVCFVHATISHLFEYRDFEFKLTMVYIVLGAFVVVHYSSFLIYLLLNNKYL